MGLLFLTLCWFYTFPCYAQDTLFYEDGAVQQIHQYGNEDHKEVTFYQKNGQLKQKSYYRNNKKIKSQGFHPNGTQYFEKEQENQLRHGVWKVWSPDGQLKEEGVFREGIAQGEFIYYDKNGEKQHIILHREVASMPEFIKGYNNLKKFEKASRRAKLKFQKKKNEQGVLLTKGQSFWQYSSSGSTLLKAKIFNTQVSLKGGLAIGCTYREFIEENRLNIKDNYNSIQLHQYLEEEKMQLSFKFYFKHQRLVRIEYEKSTLWS